MKGIIAMVAIIVTIVATMPAEGQVWNSIPTIFVGLVTMIVLLKG